MDATRLNAIRQRIFSDYAARAPRSKELYERAKMCMAGGIPSTVRFHDPYALMFERAHGCKLIDADGNEYINCLLNAGPQLLGATNPEVVKAAKEGADDGLLVLNSTLAIDFSELVKEILPSADLVRMAQTGSESMMFALRTARAFTGKKKIIKFFGHYNGLNDEVLTGLLSGDSGIEFGGISAESISNTIVVPYNDIDALREVLDADHDVAAIILDPQMNAGGIWPAPKKYLEDVRELTTKRGVVLIFDEVITGFRWALGGAQQWYDVVPDLTCLAKAIGGGAKVGCLAGKAEIMSGIDYNSVLQAGTFTDGVIGYRAAIAAMKEYKRLDREGQYPVLFARALRFKDAVVRAFTSRGIPMRVNIIGPSMKMYATDMADFTYENVRDHYDHTLTDLFIVGMINKGIYLTNPALRTIYFSFAHTNDDVDQMINAVGDTLDTYDFKSAVQ